MVLLSAQDVQLGAAGAIAQASAPATRHLGRRRDRRSPAQWLPFPTEQREMSLIEEIEATEAGAQGLAAADLAGQVSRLICAALRESNLDQKDLAEKLGVTQGRVSQVVNGDGNLRVAAVARYMRALGYELTLTATPVQEGLPELPKRRYPRQSAESSSSRCAHGHHSDSIADAALDAWRHSFAGQASAIAHRLYTMRSRTSISNRVFDSFDVDVAWTRPAVTTWHLVADDDKTRLTGDGSSLSRR